MLEVGSGSGGPALFVARTVGCHVTGIDINEFGNRNANKLARQQKLDALAHFQRADASHRLPFATNAFDAILSNDAMCHVPRREAVLQEWYRVLKPGGRMLFTDAMTECWAVRHSDYREGIRTAPIFLRCRARA